MGTLIWTLIALWESGLGCLWLYASFLIPKETRVVDCYSVWNVRQSIIEKIMESLHFEHNMIKLSWILIDLLNLWSSTLSSTEINLNFEMILEGNEKKIHTNNYWNTLLTKLICIQMYSHFLSPLYKRNHFNLIKNTWNNSLTWEFTIDKLAILTKPPNQCGKIYTCQNRLFFSISPPFFDELCEKILCNDASRLLAQKVARCVRTLWLNAFYYMIDHSQRIWL